MGSICVATFAEISTILLIRMDLVSATIVAWNIQLAVEFVTSLHIAGMTASSLFVPNVLKGYFRIHMFVGLWKIGWTGDLFIMRC